MTTPQASSRKLPPVLGKLLTGTFWLALRTPLQAVFALWQVPLIMQAIGNDMSGAYGFAWGFGFLQFLLEFGMSSALQRQVSERWTQGDRAGVDRAVACGMNFYAVVALIQAVALLFVAHVLLPTFWADHFTAAESRLVVKLLWLQAVTAPCYGLTAVVSSVLQAARRFDFIPRLELFVIIGRFAVLWVGVHLKVDFFSVVVTQTVVQVTLSLGPALWVMVRELGQAPTFRGTRLVDYRALLHISFYMFLIQLSVVLADKVDTIILASALNPAGPPLAVYTRVSKPFLQIRQTGWMLAYMVMPAVASLIAARDDRSLDRLKYDGTRLHVGALLPVALLAWVYAAPFLGLWVGDKPGYDPATEPPLLRLFLLATLPLVMAVPVQAAFGMNKPEVVAIAALVGSLINLPLSYFLTKKLGVAGVIWGTVLTTLFSNLLVPGIYIFRVLNFNPWTFLTRTLRAPVAGASALLVATWLLQGVYPLDPDPRRGFSLLYWLTLTGHVPAFSISLLTAAFSLLSWLPLGVHLTVACLAYAAGYLSVPVGRSDLVEIAGKFLGRAGRG